MAGYITIVHFGGHSMEKIYTVQTFVIINKNDYLNVFWKKQMLTRGAFIWPRVH